MDSTHSTSESETDDALDKLWKQRLECLDKSPGRDSHSLADAAAPAQGVASDRDPDIFADAAALADAAAPAQGLKCIKAANAKKAREALAKKRARAQSTTAAQQLQEYVLTDGEKKAVETILRGGGPVDMKLLEKVTGASKYFLSTLVPVAGQTILDLDQKAFMDLLEEVTQDVDSGSLRGVAFFFSAAMTRHPPWLAKS